MVARTSTRERIVETAADLFARRGFSRASLQDVADHLGITKAALYYHFESKDEILLTVLRPYFDAAGEFLTHHTRQGSDRHAVLTAYLDLLLEHRTALDVIAFDRSVLNHPEIGEMSYRQTEELLRLMTGPSPGLDRRVAASAALGAVRSATALLRDSNEPSVRAAVLRAATAALDTGD